MRNAACEKGICTVLTEEKGPPIAVGLIRPLALLVVLLLGNHGSVCMEMGSWWPIQEDGYMLLVFAAVFIGGTSVFGGAGRLYGTLIGIAIVGIIEAGIASSGLSGDLTRAVHGLVIVPRYRVTRSFRSCRRLDIVY